jgi:hypothetical protein
MKQPKERDYYKKVTQENKPITFNKKALQEIQELLKNSKHDKYDKEKKSE